MYKLKSFNEKNGISIDEFDDIVHNQILLIVFQETVSILNNNPELKVDILDGYRAANYKHLYLSRFIQKQFGLNFNAQDLEELNNWMIAYFRKSDVRRKVANEIKETLLSQQQNKCFFCKKLISIDNLEIDHKIPWSLVGDELSGNLVATCFSCNREKQNKIDLGLRWLILKKGEMIGNSQST